MFTITSRARAPHRGVAPLTLILLIVALAQPAGASADPAGTRAEIARVALGQEGIREGRGNCNRYGPCREWCAMFATWAWHRAGVRGVPRGIQRARGLGLWGTEKGLFKPRPDGDGVPQVGDLVIWGAPSSAGAGHVDVVTRVRSGTIDVVGGNVDDRVRLRTIDPATARVQRDGQSLGISGYVSPPGLGTGPGGEPDAPPAGATQASFDGVAVVSRTLNSLDVFVRGSDYALMHRNWSGTRWSRWVALGGRLDSEPAAAVTDGGRRIDVLARGRSGNLSSRTWTAAHGWGGWRDLGGGRITSSPSVTSRVDGTLDAFALTANNIVSHRYRYGDGHWSRWVRLGRQASSGPAAIASNGAERLHVFARDLDGSLLQRAWTKAHGWHRWIDLGGAIVGRPAVTSRTKRGYALDVFTRGAPRLDLQHWFSRDGSSWLKPVSLGGPLFATPGAVAWGPDRIDVFSRDNDNQLIQRSWSPATAWQPYQGLGATPAPPVAPPAAPPEQQPPAPSDARDPDAPPGDPSAAVRAPRRWAAGNLYQARTALDGRSTPRLDDRRITDHVRAGQWVRIECQTLGERAYGSRIWDRVGGLYVPDRFIRTHTDGFLPGAPRCRTAIGRPAKRPARLVRRAACQQVREDQEITLDFVQRREQFAYDKSMVPARDIWRRPDRLVPIGRLRIGGATCRAAGGWRALSPLAIDYSSAGLDGNGDPTGDDAQKGLGIGVIGGRGPGAARAPYLDIGARTCGTGFLWAIAGKAAGTLAPPLIKKVSKPVLRLLLTGALKAGLHLLPTDKVKCRELATYRVSVWASRSGVLQGAAEASSFHPVQTEQTVPGTRTIVEVNRWTTEVPG